MKRKPNKPRPEAQTHTEPVNGAAEPGGSAFGAGSEQEPGAAGTSGQSVPKSKFRQKSQQEQAAASKLRMEKRGEKREAAREKLAKQKPPKQKGPIRKAAGAAGWGVHGFVHGKLYEVEQENVGTEGAHRSELVGESGLRHGKRFVQKKIRQHPAKAVQRAESKYVKATADYHFRMAAQEHPELEKNAWKRFWQKRQYRKQARQTARAGAAKAAKQTAAATERAGAQAVGFIKRHPVGVLLALACVLLLFIMQSCSSSLVMFGNSGAGAVGATTYPSKDEDILGAEAAYADMEAELQNYLDTYESTHDYDENTILTWTGLNTIPMCSSPSSLCFTRGNGRLPRYRAPWKCSLTANTFSPRMWWWRCATGRKPAQTARATIMRWKSRITGISAM